MTVFRYACEGARSAVPIGVGYLPVAVTFGAAAISFGYPPYIPVLFSAAIFAGGSQFILLAAMHSGTSWLYAIALCAVIDSRHLLYGSLLRRIFPLRTSARIPLAMSLTDEVFATALTQRGKARSSGLTAWLIGVAAVAYGSWVLSTMVGAAIGVMLQQEAPALVHALKFALPALFLALSLAQLERGNVVPLGIAAIGAFIGVALGNIITALLAAAATACIVCIVQQTVTSDDH